MSKPTTEVRGARRFFIRVGGYLVISLFLLFLVLPLELALPVLILEYAVIAITFYYATTTPGNRIYRLTHRSENRAEG